MSSIPEKFPTGAARFSDRPSRAALRIAIGRLDPHLNAILSEVFLDEIPIDRFANSLGIEVDVANRWLEEGLKALKTPRLRRILDAQRPKRRVFRPTSCCYCGRGFGCSPVSKPGRPRRYCDPLCRQRAHRARQPGIPSTGHGSCDEQPSRAI